MPAARRPGARAAPGVGRRLSGAAPRCSGDGAKGLSLIVEDAKRRDGVIHQPRGPLPRFVRSEQAHEGGLSGCGVLAHGLAEIGLRAFVIEQVVGDLEGEPDAGGVVAKCRARHAVFLRENSPRLARKSEEGAGLEPLQLDHLVEGKLLALRRKVDCLPPRHSLAAGSPRQRTSEFGTHRSVGMTGRRRHRLEGEREQGIADQDRCRLVEGDMAGRLAAAKVVVVHRRQVVMDERIGVHHLDGGGGVDGPATRHIEEVCAREHQEGA